MRPEVRISTDKEAAIQMEYADSYEKLWCEDCHSSHGIDCPKSGPPPRVRDRRLSKVVASLPECLSISATEGSRQVVAAAQILRRTLFGPLEARRVEGDSAEECYTFKLFRDRSVLCCLDTRDEEECNWMALVDVSPEPDFQNLRSIQHNGEIYFLALREIQPGELLRVGLSPSHTARLRGGQQGRSRSGVCIREAKPERIYKLRSNLAGFVPHREGDGPTCPGVPDSEHRRPQCDSDHRDCSARKEVILSGDADACKDSQASPESFGSEQRRPQCDSGPEDPSARKEVILSGETDATRDSQSTPEMFGSEQMRPQCDSGRKDSSARKEVTLSEETTAGGDVVGSDGNNSRGPSCSQGAFAGAVSSGNDDSDNDNIEDGAGVIIDHSYIDSQRALNPPHCPTEVCERNTDGTTQETQIIGNSILDPSHGNEMDVPSGSVKHPGTKCPLCHSPFQDLRHHLVDGHSLSEDTARTLLGSNFPCPFCFNCFLSPTMLHDHLVQAHSGLARDPLRCAKCPERFEGFSGLQNHEMGHTSLLTAVCHECGRRVLKVNIDDHVSEEHPNGSGYRCEGCERRTSSFMELMQHVKGEECHGERELDKGKGIPRELRKRKTETHGRKRGLGRRNSHVQENAELGGGRGHKRKRSDPGPERDGGHEDCSVSRADRGKTGRRKRNELDSGREHGSSYGNRTRIGERRGQRIGQAEQGQTGGTKQREMISLGSSRIGLACKKKGSTLGSSTNSGDKEAGRVRRKTLDGSLNDKRAAASGGFVTEDNKRSDASEQGSALHSCQPSQKSALSLDGSRTGQDGTRVSCRLCAFDSGSAMRLQEHVLNAHRGVDAGIPEQFRHPCSDCGRVFLRLGHLTRHMQAHLPKQVCCGTCSHQFADVVSLKLHQCPDGCRGNNDGTRDEGENTLYECKICGREFAVQKVLSVHIHTHFRNIPNGHGQSVLVEVPGGKDDPLSCSHCHFQFAHASAFHEHHRKVHKVETHLCCVCHSNFVSRGLLLVHLATHADKACSEIGDLRSTLGDFLTCQHCFAIVPNASTLKRHMAIHLKVKDFICDRCGNMFGRRDALEAHSRVHDRAMSYSCQICCKGFRSRRSLQVHFGVHQGEREYQCHVCSRGFTQRGNLNKHLTKCAR